MSDDHNTDDREENPRENQTAEGTPGEKSPGEGTVEGEFQSIMARLSPNVRRILREGPQLENPPGCGYCGTSGEEREAAGCFGGGYLEIEVKGTIEAHRCPHAAAYHRRRRVARAAETSGTGRLGAKQTFETFDAERCSDPRTRRAAEILANLGDDAGKADEELDRPARGVLLVGDTGTGKSHLLRAATIEAIDRGAPARFLEVHRLISSVQDSYDAARNGRGDRNDRASDAAPPKTRTQILDEIAAAEIVCLDDLGSEQNTEHTSQILFELLDRLEAEQRILVVATNLGVDDIQARYGKRVNSRLLGMCARLNLAEERDHRC